MHMPSLNAAHSTISVLRELGVAELREALRARAHARSTISVLRELDVAELLEALRARALDWQWLD